MSSLMFHLCFSDVPLVLLVMLIYILFMLILMLSTYVGILPGTLASYRRSPLSQDNQLVAFLAIESKERAARRLP